MINYSDIYLYCDDFKRLKTLTSLFNSFLLKHFDLFLNVINTIIEIYKELKISKCLRRIFIIFAMHTRDKQSNARNRHAIACQFPSTIRRNFEVHIGDIV